MTTVPKPILQKLHIPSADELHQIDQGRAAACENGITRPPVLPAGDVYYVERWKELEITTEVFLAADPDPRYNHDTTIGRPWMLCWHVGQKGDRFRVIEVTHAKNSWVYWGTYTKVMRLTDYDAFPIATLSLPKRSGLEEIASNIPIPKSTENRQTWFKRLLAMAIGLEVLESHKVERALAYLDACDIPTEEFKKIIDDRICSYAKERAKQHAVQGSMKEDLCFSCVDSQSLC